MKNIPLTAVSRLSIYYRALAGLGRKKFISSGDIAEMTGYSDAVIRRDLSYFGKFGVPGKGYPVSDLREKIIRILGIDREWRIALIGLGNLGRALIKYRGFEKKGFVVASVFDKDPEKIGRVVYGLEVQDIKTLREKVRQKGINMAVITVPAGAAGDVISRVLDSGVNAILNFAPVKAPEAEGARVVNIDIGLEMEKLSFLSARPGPRGVNRRRK